MPYVGQRRSSSDRGGRPSRSYGGPRRNGVACVGEVTPRTPPALPRLWPSGRDGLESRDSLAASDATPRVLDRKVVCDIIESSKKCYKKFSNGNCYVGQLCDGALHGHGVYTWKDGSTYDGEFRAGKMSGYGLREWIGGQRYVGQWKEDIMSGEGMLELPNGEVYEGQFLLGAYHGRGTRTLANGDRCTGMLRDGLQEGEATTQSADGSWVFTGLYLHGRMYGPGRIEWADGSSYVGEWRDNIREGQGRWDAPDGSWFEGSFKRNCPDGYGRQVFADGSSFDGEFREGIMQGAGTFRWPCGTELEGNFNGHKFYGEACQRLPSGVEIVGTFDEHGACGPGKKRWPNGCSFEGELLRSCIEKQGILRWPDGRCYTGAFADGAMHGHGQLEWESGNGRCTYRGEFKNNLFDGPGVLHWADGGSYEGNFKAGMYHGEGSFTWPGRTAIYKGNWRRGTMSGQGLLTVNPTSNNESRSYTYLGDFADGHMDGHGQVSFIPRHGVGTDEYKGAFKASRFTGLGTFTWRFGATLSGLFEDNFCNRVGRKKYPDGHEYTGGLRFDMEHGKGLVNDSGRITVGIWENGKFLEKLVASYDLDLEEKVVSGGRYVNTAGGRKSRVDALGAITAVSVPRTPKMSQNSRLPAVHDARGMLVEGKAVIDFLSGDRYLGYMRKGRKHGFGMFVYSDLVSYKGIWKADHLDGIRHPVTEGSPPIGVRLLSSVVQNHRRCLDKDGEELEADSATGSESDCDSPIVSDEEGQDQESRSSSHDED